MASKQESNHLEMLTDTEIYAAIRYLDPDRFHGRGLEFSGSEIFRDAGGNLVE